MSVLPNGRRLVNKRTRKMEEWPVMNCVAEQAFADPTFYFPLLACINRGWNEMTRLFIKRLTKKEYPHASAERLAIMEKVMLTALTMSEDCPHPVVINDIRLQSLAIGKRMYARFRLDGHYYSDTARTYSRWKDVVECAHRLDADEKRAKLAW